MTYTDLEMQVIKSFSVAFNYSNAEDEISDNATAISAIDIAAATGLNVRTVKGVMGSLHKKGLLIDWGGDLNGNSAITEEGIEAHYSLK